MYTHIQRLAFHLIQIVLQIEHGFKGIGFHVNVLSRHKFQRVKAHRSGRMCYISFDKNERSGLSIFLFSFLIFIFDLFSIILFLELGLGLE